MFHYSKLVSQAKWTMVDHGRPWSTTNYRGHTTMVDHGRPCFVKWHTTVNDHGRPWSVTMVSDHGRPWSVTMVDRGH